MRTLLFGLLLLTACSTGDVETPRSGRVLRLATLSDPGSLDPRVSVDRRAQVITTMLFEGLVRVGPDGHLVPAAAETIDVSLDGKTYTFTLRRTFWSTGDPVTAHDFAAAWKRDLGALNDHGFDVVDAIEVVDEQTLIVTLKHPAPYFLDLISNGVFFPVSAFLDKLDPSWSTNSHSFVSNGPYRLVAWTKDSELQLEKNPHYWDRDAVYFDTIRIAITPDPEALYHRGDIDWVGEPLSDAVDGESQPISGTYCYHFNVAMEPFTSPSLRRAFAYALSRPDPVATSPLPPALSFSGDPLLKRQNRADAQILFERGLRELNQTRRTLPKIVLSYHAKDKLLAQAAQAQWKEVFDIDVAIEGYEWKTFRTNLLNHAYQLAGATWYSWTNDPLYALESLDMTLWDNPTYNELLESARATADPELRAAYLERAEHLALSEMPVIPMSVATYSYLSRLQGVIITPSGQVDFKCANTNHKK